MRRKAGGKINWSRVAVSANHEIMASDKFRPMTTWTSGSKGADQNRMRIVHLRKWFVLVVISLHTISAVNGQTAGSKASVKDRDPIGEEKPREKAKPITEIVPFFGKSVREKGFDLPLPFGLNLIYTNMRQHAAVSDLRIGKNETPITDITIPDPFSKDHNVTLRGDMWLFPFMNIYGLVGYTNGRAEVDVDITGLTVTIPNPFDPKNPIVLPIPDIQIKESIEYNGITTGGGTTLAAGYRYIFGTVDMNYTWTNLNLADNTIQTFTVAPRAGILVTTKEAGNGSVYLGGMYLNYEQTLSGVADLTETIPALGMLPYKLRLNGRNPWNALAGGTWDLHDRWSIQGEVGFVKRKHFQFSGMFRF